ncbi:hypothetical protein BFS06_11475 [Clostridium perfringens]|uniref:Uncharacterized protein n=1 Tax=Clostridium perfringens TaxID=1502 RepID=A0A140GS05_CLOPF|nr:hypothetical protein [Clostridium perfringens]AMN31314.1 hypothetical protein JFP838_pA0398 [Clostridium perfringens]TBX14834.1 hypothetical protein BFS06_11475 [Clostridium perfringens]
MENQDIMKLLNNINNDTNLVIVDDNFTTFKVKELLKKDNEEIVLVSNVDNSGDDILIQDLLKYIDDNKSNIFSAKLNNLENLTVENIYYSNELNSVVFSVI